MKAKTITYFVSYSRANQVFALRLAEELRSNGVNLWIDQLDIPAGERWDRSVEAALETAQGLLVLLSRTSVESDNVMDEVSYALSEKKRVIPILIENCEVPFRLQRLQYIDLTISYEQGLSRLLASLGAEKKSGIVISPEPSSKKVLLVIASVVFGCTAIGGGIAWRTISLRKPVPVVEGLKPDLVTPEKEEPKIGGVDPSILQPSPPIAPTQEITNQEDVRDVTGETPLKATSLQYYQRTVDPSALRTYLGTEAIAGEFDVNYLSSSSDLEDTPTNAIWFGPEVPKARVQLLARGLMENGVRVQIIERKDGWPSEKSSLVQLGGSVRGKNNCSSDWTVADVENATEFPIANDNAPTSGCAEP